MSRTNEIRHMKWQKKLVNLNVDQRKTFVILNKGEIKINVDINAKY